MPTYEYACAKCGHKFDHFQSMKDKPLSVCPKEKCKLKKWGKGRVKKLMSTGAGLIFKGSGFYITDYRSENYKAGAKKESAAGETKSASGEAKSASGETKSAGGETKSTGGESKAASAKSESKPAAGATPAKTK